MEDDFTLCDNFKQKIDCLNHKMKELPIIFFGFSMFEKNRENVKHIYDVESKTIKIEKLVKELYIGGTHCYSINKIGAKHMLNYISQNGIKHGIDYVIGKLNPEICYESQPHLVFAEWSENNKKIDSDIQNVYEYKGKMPDFVQGRGGTDMNPFIEYFNQNKQYTNLIILTDGFIGSNIVKTFRPTLMVLCSQGASIEEVKNNGWGSTIKINLAS